VTAALPADAWAAASEISMVLLAMNGDDAAYGELVTPQAECHQKSAAAPDPRRRAGR